VAFTHDESFTLEWHYILKCLWRRLEALIRESHRETIEMTCCCFDVERLDPCDDSREKEERNVRSRTILLGFVLVVALALCTGSVLIGYLAVAASALTVLTLLVKRATRRESIAPTESFVPRWVDAEDREAA